MSERIRASKPVKIANHICSDESWQELLVALNKNDDEVQISKHALEDCQLCENEHSAMRGEPAYQFKPGAIGRRWVEMDRKQVWDFVQGHHHKAGTR